jgi:hypothetical protein
LWHFRWVASRRFSLIVKRFPWLVWLAADKVNGTRFATTFPHLAGVNLRRLFEIISIQR